MKLEVLASKAMVSPGNETQRPQAARRLLRAPLGWLLACLLLGTSLAGCGTGFPTEEAITAADARFHVASLTTEAMDGRRTGTPGERLATQYAADVFASLGLKPAGENGTYFQEFEAGATTELDPSAVLTVEAGGVNSNLKTGTDWQPMGITKLGEIAPAPVVFVGYGVQAEATTNADPAKAREAYKSYEGADVKGKWVIVLRYLPESLKSQGQKYTSHSSLTRKINTAATAGALGVMIVTLPQADGSGKEDLIPVSYGGGVRTVASISISRATAAAWLKLAGKDLQTVRKELDGGAKMPAIEIPGVKVGGSMKVKREPRIGRNVIARLQIGEKPTGSAVMVGGHIDHLGRGPFTGSLAQNVKPHEIHHGADDNASGISATLEVAQYMAGGIRSGAIKPRRDMLFVCWSGEELGLIGSKHYTRAMAKNLGTPNNIRAEIGAYLNMDMVGRLREKLSVEGVGSSKDWPAIVEQANAQLGIPITLKQSPYLPTDSTALYEHGVPVLIAFTDLHDQYHRPTDTIDTLNIDGIRKVSQFMGNVTRILVEAEKLPQYTDLAKPQVSRTSTGVYLGSVPHYTAEGKGLTLQGINKGSPAEKAGLKAGDMVLKLGDTEVTEIHSYTQAINNLKAGQETTIIIERQGKKMELKITPGTRPSAN